MGYVISQEYPFTICVGGRCVGKTYGALKYMLESGRRFIYMRRTLTQLQTIKAPEISPFAAVCDDMGLEFDIKNFAKNVYAVYIGEESLPRCLMCALSGISSMRGLSGREYTQIVYDECIPEAHEKPMKEEAAAIWNAYNTFNRERETLRNEKPMQLLMLANANNIVNPIYESLKIINDVYAMAAAGQHERKYPERGLYFVDLDTRLSDTFAEKGAMSRLLAGSKVAAMMYKNEYYSKPALTTKSENLKEYIPMVTIGEITCYRHKSEFRFCVSPHGSGGRVILTTADNDKKRFRTNYWILQSAYMKNLIYFENPACEIIFASYMQG